ncbi:hypothetical protein EV174_004095 [Coemansia sp. RSA 2320]|nr:hypothetical protein EV174_004095 [Coemansia sp. RSA 2320]
MLCHKCGRPGHMAAVCEEPEKICFNCSQPGHLTLDCPLPRDNSLKECFNCGNRGHISKECPEPRQPKKPVKRAPKSSAAAESAAVPVVVGMEASSGIEGRLGKPRGARGGASKKAAKCFNCGGLNHLAKDCTKEAVVCHSCGRSGHIAKLCRDRDQTERTEDRECHVCHDVGHIARNCPQAVDDQGERIDTRECRECHEVGHIARNCPQGSYVPKPSSLAVK